MTKSAKARHGALFVCVVAYVSAIALVIISARS